MDRATAGGERGGRSLEVIHVGVRESVHNGHPALPDVNFPHCELQRVEVVRGVLIKIISSSRVQDYGLRIVYVSMPGACAAIHERIRHRSVEMAQSTRFSRAVS